MQLETCQWCALMHTGICPRVKAIDYAGGVVVRVEFWPPPESSGYRDLAHDLTPLIAENLAELMHDADTRIAGF